MQIFHDMVSIDAAIIGIIDCFPKYLVLLPVGQKRSFGQYFLDFPCFLQRLLLCQSLIGPKWLEFYDQNKSFLFHVLSLTIWEALLLCGSLMHDKLEQVNLTIMDIRVKGALN